MIPIFYGDTERPVFEMRNGLLIEIRPDQPIGQVSGDSLECLDCKRSYYMELKPEDLSPWLELPVEKGSVGCAVGGKTCRSPGQCRTCKVAPVESHKVTYPGW